MYYNKTDTLTPILDDDIGPNHANLTTILQTELNFNMGNINKYSLQREENDIYVFCYGSDDPEQLCDRVGADYRDLISRTFPATATGWRRGFKGHSKGWGGCSTATIFETGKQEDTVCGTVVRMTPEEVTSLDPFEGCPYKYCRKIVKLTAYKPTTVSGSPRVEFKVNSQAYIMPEDRFNDFCDPSPAYKIACCKTIYTARRLLDKGDDRDITLKIYNAATKELKNEFKYSITNKDIPMNS